MTPENFAYWLQGFIELNGTSDGLTAEQLDTVRRHLSLVLINVTDEKGQDPIERQIDEFINGDPTRRRLC